MASMAAVLCPCEGGRCSGDWCANEAATGDLYGLLTSGKGCDSRG